jgi:hypothetical protein
MQTLNAAACGTPKNLQKAQKAAEHKGSMM